MDSSEDPTSAVGGFAKILFAYLAGDLGTFFYFSEGLKPATRYCPVRQSPNVLVATDVLGRGIDLPNVRHGCTHQTWRQSGEIVI